MTTYTSTPHAAPAAHEERELTVDSLDIRDAVIGDGVMLTQSGEHRYVLHTLGAGRAKLLGSYDNVAGALAALDAFDELG